jgi:hypothetical protein
MARRTPVSLPAAPDLKDLLDQLVDDSGADVVMVLCHGAKLVMVGSNA